MSRACASSDRGDGVPAADPFNRGMESRESRRVELVLPLRTVLLVVATLAVMAAFVAIGDTFLVIFVGIFLALVFEFPVRFVMAKTGLSRGLAATVTVLGAALAVTLLALLFLVRIVGNRARLPQGPAVDRRGAAPVGRALVSRRHRSRGERATGRAERGRVGARRDLRACSGWRAPASRSSSPRSRSSSRASSCCRTSATSRGRWRACSRPAKMTGGWLCGSA